MFELIQMHTKMMLVAKPRGSQTRRFIRRRSNSGQAGTDGAVDTYEGGDLRILPRGGVFCFLHSSFLRHPMDSRLYLLQVCIISGKPQQSWVDSSTSTPPSIHKTSEKWTKSVSLTNRIQLVFQLFFTGICSDRWVGVEESIRDCCGLPEML